MPDGGYKSDGISALARLLRAGRWRVGDGESPEAVAEAVWDDFRTAVRAASSKSATPAEQPDEGWQERRHRRP